MTDELPAVDDCGTHRDAMVRLALAMGWTKGVEVGVGAAYLSRALMEGVPSLELVGVDAGYRDDRRKLCKKVRNDYRDRYVFMRSDSVDAAPRIATRSCDFVFIDAGHSYRAVHDDIRAWRERVKPSGWLLGHDYDHPDLPGVREAVDEWFGDRVRVLGHTIWAIPGRLIHGPETTP